MKTQKPSKKRVDAIEYTESSGNVFADLGILNPEEALAKAEIASKIHDIIKEKKLTQAKALSLPDALTEFSNWIPKGAIVWGNGSDFDNVILKNAYRLVDMPVPWPKFNDRCFRTMKAIFKDVQRPKREGIAHSALDDAIFQATWILKIFEEKFKKEKPNENQT